MAEVRYEQATRIYPGTEVPALNGLDLEIADGEFMVLVGPSAEEPRCRDGVPELRPLPVSDRRGEHRVSAQGGEGQEG